MPNGWNGRMGSPDPLAKAHMISWRWKRSDGVFVYGFHVITPPNIGNVKKRHWKRQQQTLDLANVAKRNTQRNFLNYVGRRMAQGARNVNNAGRVHVSFC